MLLKRYDVFGNELSPLSVEIEHAPSAIVTRSIEGYITAIRANKRQWSANTKGRSDIALSNRKPHKQKGTGRARQGCIKTSQYRKGAVVFGPRPKFDQHVRINKKERRAAISGLMYQIAIGGRLFLLNYTGLKKPSTCTISQLFDRLGVDGRVIVLGDSVDAYRFLCLSIRNLQRVQSSSISCVNGYDLACARWVIVVDSASDKLGSMLGGCVS